MQFAIATNLIRLAAFLVVRLTIQTRPKFAPSRNQHNLRLALILALLHPEMLRNASCEYRTCKYMQVLVHTRRLSSLRIAKLLNTPKTPRYTYQSIFRAKRHPSIITPWPVRYQASRLRRIINPAPPIQNSLSSPWLRP